MRKKKKITTMDEFIRKYGTATTSILIRKMSLIMSEEKEKVMREMADDLEAALVSVAHKHVEPMKVDND